MLKHPYLEITPVPLNFSEMMENTQQALDEAFDCIFSINAELQVTYWNRSMQELTGYNQAAAHGKQIFELVPSLKDECDYYFRKAILEEGRVIDLPLLKLYKPISGKELVVRARFVPVDQDGAIKGLTGILDVQPTNQINENAYLDLLQSVVMNSNDAILITRAEPVGNDEGPKIIFANPAFTRMSGYEAREVLGFTPKMLQGSGTSSEAKQKIREGLRNWEAINCELLNYTKRGKEFWVDLGIVPVSNEEGFYTHWIAIQREVTDKRQNIERLENDKAQLEEEVQQRTADLEAFSYFLAHDARQPIRTITTFAQLLRRELADDQKAKEYLDIMIDAGVSLNDMVEGLERLTLFSKQDMLKEPVDLNPIVDRLLSELQKSHPEMKVDAIVESDLVVRADRQLISPLLQNILGNSVKYFTKKEPLKIVVRRKPDPQYDIIEFEDNGDGFDSGNIDSFKMFERGHSVSEQSGSGIGLALCKKIVERHQGKISVESQRHEGTTIRVEFPKK